MKYFLLNPLVIIYGKYNTTQGVDRRAYDTDQLSIEGA